ncbi:MAG: glycosyltransferase family 1 protein [Gammaproteobacteria bacterium]|nr:MAG: glycosyltransferase family 1 protein [Gammaproteobacteria bacterium]
MLKEPFSTVWNQARAQYGHPDSFEELKIQLLDADTGLPDDRKEQLCRVDKLPPPRSALPPSRILLITNLYPPQAFGGYGLLMADFARILAAMGHELHVLTSNTDYLGKAPSQEKGISRALKVFGRWENGKTEIFQDERAQQISRENYFTVLEYVKSFHPDFCLVGDIGGLSCLVFQPLRDNHIPVIHHLGNAHPGYVPANIPTLGPDYTLATASNWLKAKILNEGYSLPNIETVYSAGDISLFYNPLLPQFDKLKIIFAGIMQPYKGPQTLLQALLFLKQNNIDFQCTFAGGTTDDAFLKGFKEDIKSFGIDKQVTLTGKLGRSELRDRFFEHNILVFPSLVDETFGMSQVEAMAAGLVVIGTGSGGAAEVIRHGETGLLFPKGDAQTLTKLLYTLLQNPQLAMALSRNGQQAARQYFNVEVSTTRLTEIFAKMKTV